jgi:type IV secretory pathway VirB3-like protein
MLGVSFDLSELWYRFVILAVGVLNVALDNWLMILIIVVVWMLWRCLIAEVDDEG